MIREIAQTTGPALASDSNRLLWVHQDGNELSRALRSIFHYQALPFIILLVFLSFFKDRVKLVLVEGIEPTAPGVRVRYSDQLSYTSVRIDAATSMPVPGHHRVCSSSYLHYAV